MAAQSVKLEAAREGLLRGAGGGSPKTPDRKTAPKKASPSLSPVSFVIRGKVCFRGAHSGPSSGTRPCSGKEGSPGRKPEDSTPSSLTPLFPRLWSWVEPEPGVSNKVQNSGDDLPIFSPVYMCDFNFEFPLTLPLPIYYNPLEYLLVCLCTPSPFKSLRGCSHSSPLPPARAPDRRVPRRSVWALRALLVLLCVFRFPAQRERIVMGARGGAISAVRLPLTLSPMSAVLSNAGDNGGEVWGASGRCCAVKTSHSGVGKMVRRGGKGGVDSIRAGAQLQRCPIQHGGHGGTGGSGTAWEGGGRGGFDWARGAAAAPSYTTQSVMGAMRGGQSYRHRGETGRMGCGRGTAACNEKSRRTKAKAKGNQYKLTKLQIPEKHKGTKCRTLFFCMHTYSLGYAGLIPLSPPHLSFSLLPLIGVTRRRVFFEKVKTKLCQVSSTHIGAANMVKLLRERAEMDCRDGSIIAANVLRVEEHWLLLIFSAVLAAGLKAWCSDVWAHWTPSITRSMRLCSHRPFVWWQAGLA
ncbi:hypothetical protein C8R46DRAFT_1035853 [Mycena filopes]|nr:hypothetical protein C8R46DRAFT_1035853 [Mycena filopes]